MNREYIIYLFAVLLLGLFYYPIKQWLDNATLFVLLTIAYLVLVRCLGAFFKEKNGKDQVEE